MSDFLQLTDVERELIVGLLEQELKDLPVEIHHTRNSKMREELVARRQMVREVLEKLHAVAASV